MQHNLALLYALGFFLGFDVTRNVTSSPNDAQFTSETNFPNNKVNFPSNPKWVKSSVRYNVYGSIALNYVKCRSIKFSLAQ